MGLARICSARGCGCGLSQLCGSTTNNWMRSAPSFSPQPIGSLSSRTCAPMRMQSPYRPPPTASAVLRPGGSRRYIRRIGFDPERGVCTVLAPGDEFVGYTIRKVLGRGGMGTVYLAKHPRLPRLTALKLLNRELYTDNEIRRRFEREADLARSEEHTSELQSRENLVCRLLLE